MVEISEGKLNLALKCLVRIHHVETGDEVQRFKDKLLKHRKKDILEIMHLCESLDDVSQKSIDKVADALVKIHPIEAEKNTEFKHLLAYHRKQYIVDFIQLCKEN